MIVVRRIHGQSMSPVLKPGKIVIGLKTKNVKAGDIIIFTHHGLEKIKKVTSKLGKRYFVEGLNKKHSTDSNQFGYIDARSVIAKMIWPRV